MNLELICYIRDRMVVSFFCRIEQMVQFQHKLDMRNPVDYFVHWSLDQLLRGRAMHIPFMANNATSLPDVIQDILPHLFMVLKKGYSVSCGVARYNDMEGVPG